MVSLRHHFSFYQSLKLINVNDRHKKRSSFLNSFSVGPLGLEPRLFGTKNRRVASYTMGHSDGAKVATKINSALKKMKKNQIFVQKLKSV